MKGLIFLTLIIVFIVDLTDAPITAKKVLSFILTRGKYIKTDYRVHLLDCSLCITWWAGLLYLIITNNFTLPLIAFVALLSFSTSIIKNIFLLINGILNYIIATIEEKL